MLTLMTAALAAAQPAAAPNPHAQHAPAPHAQTAPAQHGAHDGMMKDCCCKECCKGKGDHGHHGRTGQPKRGE